MNEYSLAKVQFFIIGYKRFLILFIRLLTVVSLPNTLGNLHV